MTRLRDARRSAFTLLEMMLAMAIGILLLSGLYVALDIHLAATSSGRVQIEQAQVSRWVAGKLTSDIKQHLARLDLYPAPLTTNTASVTSTDPTLSNTFIFNLAVQGDSDRLILYISKVPRAAMLTSGANGVAGSGGDVMVDESDLRRITYWLIPNSDGTGGLARQEIQHATSDDEIATLPPDVNDPQSMIIASMVIGATFEYYDGTNWESSWDGINTLREDLVTPIGPPLAIAITVYVANPDHMNVSLDDPSVRKFRHVVQVPAASNHNGGGLLPKLP